MTTIAGARSGGASGAEADAADIQDFADHVLRKESRRTSRYTSFAAELRVARRFTSAADNRDVRKVEMAALRELEALGAIKVWHPEEVYDALKQGPGKHRKQAAGVRAAMVRNGEVLVEGQTPAVVLEPVDS